MAPDPPAAEREADRRLSVRTLAIASVASAAAAIATSRFWIAGTPVAAALTPVIVALVSELLHRPTDAIAQRLTSDSPALRLGQRRAPGTGAVAERPAADEAAGPGAGRSGEARSRAEAAAAAEAAGAAPPGDEARERRSVPPPLDRPEGAARPAARGGEPPIRVYGAGRPPRRRLAVGVVLSTGLLAFLIAAVVLTVPELIAGGSIAKGGRDTTFFGGRDRSSREEPATTTETQTETAPQQDRTETPTEETEDQPPPTAPSPPPRTQPTEPAQRTTPAPRTTQTSPGSSTAPRRPY